MFAAIYRSYVEAGREEEYKECWRTIATYFVEKRGAYGSCLHKAEDNLFVAYSRWPDKSTRDRLWPGDDAPSDELPENVRRAILTIQECMDQDRPLENYDLDVVEDLLIPQKSDELR